MKVLAVVLVVSIFVSATFAQDLGRLLMMNMMRQQGAGGATGGSAAAGAAGGNPLMSMMGAGGMRNPFNLMLTSQLSDRARDMMMCQMMPAQFKNICMMSAMA